MSKFTGLDPIGRYLEDGVKFQLHEDCEFFLSKEENVGASIIAPAGFITDFASVPLFLHPILPPSIGRRAAIIHDWLYKTNGLHGAFTRKECDLIFLDALDVLKVRATRRYALYLGVRIGGWYSWNNYFSVYGDD